MKDSGGRMRTIGYLRQRQSLPLEAKLVLTERSITEWHGHWRGNVHVSFSGGKDSTVLLHIARSMYPNIPAVFVDTGLEYPETKAFVRTFDNVEVIRPEKSFREVVLGHGYPVVSKEVSQTICEARRADGTGKYQYRLDSLNGLHKDKDGNKSAYNYERWKHLLDAPFKISHKCCEVMKKRPLWAYERRTGSHGMTAQMACESRLRTSAWIRHGCNAFDAARPVSNPMSFWLERDVLEYIHRNGLEISPVYGKVVRGGVQPNLFGEEEAAYRTTGVSRTGCMFCMFGAHLEGSPNRFERMRETHPKIHAWCMRDVEDGGLGLGEVLDYMGIEH